MQELSSETVRNLYAFFRTLYKKVRLLVIKIFAFWNPSVILYGYLHIFLSCSSYLLKVTEDEIEEFAASYQGSENEKKDLKEIYTKSKGKMDR